MTKALVSLLMAGIAAAATTPPTISPAKTLGNPAAPIRMEVFSDFQCPSCKALYEDTLKLLTADYVAKGKIYVVHRDFPLQQHPYARQAAAYANAAARINKYELVASELFRQQTTWAPTGKLDPVVARVLNPDDMKKVRALLTDKTILAETQADVDLGTQARIDQTPTSILTYKGRQYPIPGNVPYSLFRRFLDDLLTK